MCLSSLWDAIYSEHTHNDTEEEGRAGRLILAPARPVGTRARHRGQRVWQADRVIAWAPRKAAGLTPDTASRLQSVQGQSLQDQLKLAPAPPKHIRLLLQTARGSRLKGVLPPALSSSSAISQVPRGPPAPVPLPPWWLSILNLPLYLALSSEPSKHLRICHWGKQNKTCLFTFTPQMSGLAPHCCYSPFAPTGMFTKHTKPPALDGERQGHALRCHLAS